MPDPYPDKNCRNFRECLGPEVGKCPDSDGPVGRMLPYA